MSFTIITSDYLLPFLFFIFSGFLAFLWTRFFLTFVHQIIGRELDTQTLLALCILVTIILFVAVTHIGGVSIKEAINNRRIIKVSDKK